MRDVKCRKLVVAGNGMAGVACVEQILRHKQDFEIAIYGEETHPNYNRILLSQVLAGEKSSKSIVLNAPERLAFDLESGLAACASAPACIPILATRVEDGVVLVDAERAIRLQPNKAPSRVLDAEITWGTDVGRLSHLSAPVSMAVTG